MADTKPTERHEEIQFRQLLDEAVTKPGTFMQAYSLFWNYSLGNQILALIQANRRGICVRSDCVIQSLEGTRPTCEARRKGD